MPRVGQFAPDYLGQFPQDYLGQFHRNLQCYSFLDRNMQMITVDTHVRSNTEFIVIKLRIRKNA